MNSKSWFFRAMASSALVCAMATGAAGVEVKVGDKAVAIKADKLINTKFKSLKDVKGSLVLYEYFAHW